MPLFHNFGRFLAPCIQDTSGTRQNEHASPVSSHSKAARQRVSAAHHTFLVITTILSHSSSPFPTLASLDPEQYIVRSGYKSGHGRLNPVNF